MRTKIIFRVDGHSQMGLGHVVRSLSLADMLRDDFDCQFVSRASNGDVVAELVTQRNYAFTYLPDLDRPELEVNYFCNTFLSGKEIVVLDGYHFDTEYQQSIKITGCALVCIDDIFQGHFLADVVINHCGGLDPEIYRTAPNTKLLLGTDYLLLHQIFLEAARDTKKFNLLVARENEKVFICLGGADPKNDTLEILRKCEREDSIDECIVVIGGAYQHAEALRIFSEQTRLYLRIHQNVQPEDMAALMKECSRAICSASTVAMEYLCIGGRLFLQQIADNQQHVYNYLIEEQLAFPVAALFDSELVVDHDYFEQQQKYFDGQSAYRFLKIFRALDYRINSQFRAATQEDMSLYFDWANDPVTRNQSFTTDKIELKAHRNWYTQQLEDKDIRMYILEYKGIPVGQIRFNLDRHQAILSYSVDASYRGKGFGNYLIEEGVAHLRRSHRHICAVEGFVKSENQASRKVFIRRGFREERETHLSIGQSDPRSFRYVKYFGSLTA